jgi:hypothetical protein
MELNIFSPDLEDIVDRACIVVNEWRFSSISNLGYGKMFLILSLLMKEVLIWDRWNKFVRLSF